jgi:hypothetical protein
MLDVLSRVVAVLVSIFGGLAILLGPPWVIYQWRQRQRAEHIAEEDRTLNRLRADYDQIKADLKDCEIEGRRKDREISWLRGCLDTAGINPYVRGQPPRQVHEDDGDD